MMSVMEGHLAIFNQGPLRPIPIHLTQPPGLDFRLPIQPPAEKVDKPKPVFWNPALDLSPSVKKTSVKEDSDQTRKRKMPSAVKTPVSSTLKHHASLGVSHCAKNVPSNTASSPAMRQTQVVAAAPKNVTQAMPVRDVLASGGKDSIAPCVPAIYDHIHRQITPCMDGPLAMLASKGVFFSSLFGNAGHVRHHPVPMHNHPQVISMTAMAEGHMNIQNAMALAQSRSMLERLTGQPHQPAERPHGRPPTLRPPPPVPAEPTAQTTTAQHVPNTLTERPLALQSALALAQSRAVMMDRVNAGPVISPMVTMDQAVSHGYGRKLFPCPQCRYTTDRRNNLKRHMLTMHQTSAKMLECCGILFSTKASLREHAMIFHYHGYTCYFCGRRFCRKALLKRHLSVHNGQKDFVCNVCDYATSHKSNLERHRKVHSRQEEDGKDGDGRYHDDEAQHYHDDIKSNGSEAVSHDDVSSDDLSVCSDFDDDIDVEINVHSD